MPRGEFTFVWRIKHFSYFWQKSSPVEIVSPEFHVSNQTGTTKFKLIFSDRHVLTDTTSIYRTDKPILLKLHRIDNDAPDTITLNILVSFVRKNKSLDHWKINRKTKVTLCKTETPCFISTNAEEILKMGEVLPQDVLIVRCKMWNEGRVENYILKEQCLAQTLLDVKSTYFIAVVKNFDDLIPGLQTYAHIKSASLEESIFSMSVCLSDDGKLRVIIPIEGNYIDCCHCKIFVLDNSGKWQKCFQDNMWRNYGEICEFTLCLNYETLMDTQNYLQRGTLTFKCEIIYTTEAEPQRIETIEYGPEILQQLPSNVKNPPAPEIKEVNLKSPTTLIDDLASLYMDGSLCDTKLCTETETFPAHRAVLGARSPIFKKMFSIDMREKTTDRVDIPDINADTVRKLLMFIYTDAVEDMDWQSAKELYFAADKYEIISLKDKCSCFLKLNIQPSNCYDVLLLADTHQDADLKRLVQDFIVAHDQDVFGSEEWKIFMGNHLQLAADTMYLKYARN